MIKVVGHYGRLTEVAPLAVIECFFGNLKTEIGDLDQYKTVHALIDRIEQYIKYYNERRIQLGLGGMSPVEYRESKMRLATI